LNYSKLLLSGIDWCLYFSSAIDIFTFTAPELKLSLRSYPFLLKFNKLTYELSIKSY